MERDPLSQERKSCLNFCFIACCEFWLTLWIQGTWKQIRLILWYFRFQSSFKIPLCPFQIKYLFSMVRENERIFCRQWWEAMILFIFKEF